MLHGIRTRDAAVLGVTLLIACADQTPTGVERLASPHAQVKTDKVLKTGRHTFRFDTFGNEVFWTDTLRMHEVIQSSVSPRTALAVGLKVDAGALPEGILATADLDDPATTVALMALDAVIGLKGTVVTNSDGTQRLAKVGITCALCHSAVDNSVAPGIGNRLDGWPSTDLQVGTIVSLSPALTAAQRAVYSSWPAGAYDARFNFDGINGPVRIPPVYGLAGVPCETYTCEGPISYWNAYVAITQMHGRGSFSDPRLGINIVQFPDKVTPKLPDLLAYQLSLATPAAAPGSFDATAAEQGRLVFNGSARCATCHVGATFSDAPALHAAAETGMDPRYAARGTTGKYRTTPLRGLARHAPYFHDGSAATLPAVVEHYNGVLGLGLTVQQKADLVEYLKSL